MFFVSGFCSLLYQTVWLRLGLASFGVITPVVSVIVSVFMLGLGIGSWLGGRWIGYLQGKTGLSAITFYGLAELFIGAGAFAVPYAFVSGNALLMPAGEANSLQYMVGSAVVIAASILAWSTAMGTTFPFVMAFVNEFEISDKRSFSLLYLANCAGAVLGALTTVFVLIELLGLHGTLTVAASVNCFIGAAALCWGVACRRRHRAIGAESNNKTDCEPRRSGSFCLFILFTTGFVSMAMEVVWIRAFTPVLGTLVYSFAKLLSTYLFATCAGSYLYRYHSGRNKQMSREQLLVITPICALLPVIAGDPRASLLVQCVHLDSLMLLSISPFCFFLGYLTPFLVDDLSHGNPVVAGKAYALNIAGSVLGPLLAGYLLLPALGARLSLVILALPLLLCGLFVVERLAKPVRIALLAVSAVSLFGAIMSHSWEEGAHLEFGKVVIRRDYAATVLSGGSGMNKILLVNGIGNTTLTPVTKYMAHLPLAFVKERPQSALVICFGMGTTYRSLLSWGIHVTAVELVPSVRDAFDYYFDDAKAILQNPKGRIVVDDGRRFLARTSEKFDVITIDPPPPVEAAGSSLLYSEDFYKHVKQHLRPGGILQQWFPGGEGRTLSAVTRALAESFPYVRAYRSVEGWGYHFLASSQPIADLTTEQVISKLPQAARLDLGEWCQGENRPEKARLQLDTVLKNTVDLSAILNRDSSIKITDDRPLNEYFLIAKTFSADR